MEEEIRALRQKAEALNAPSTFVQSAKLARKARVLEKKLEAKRQKEQIRSNAISRAVAWFKVSSPESPPNILSLSLSLTNTL